jgi:H+-translocating diphosphatase
MLLMLLVRPLLSCINHPSWCFLGHTTAAVGTGFAIGSAALVSIANSGAFVVRIQSAQRNAGLESNFSIQILHPLTISFLFIGSMLPYWVSALTMQSVGGASIQMVHEVQRQYMECPELLAEGTALRPDYEKCVTVSTHAALREMITPAALVILAPLLAGTLFGVHAVYGLLIGGLLTGFSLAISMSNTGRAWDNAKKYIEGGIDPSLGGKGSDCHKSAVVGYTVGDPLKDTSGPSLNILMKLMATISLVFADYFFSINHGPGFLVAYIPRFPSSFSLSPRISNKKVFKFPFTLIFLCLRITSCRKIQAFTNFQRIFR